MLEFRDPQVIQHLDFKQGSTSQRSGSSRLYYRIMLVSSTARPFHFIIFRTVVHTTAFIVFSTKACLMYVLFSVSVHYLIYESTGTSCACSENKSWRFLVKDMDGSCSTKRFISVFVGTILISPNDAFSFSLIEFGGTLDVTQYLQMVIFEILLQPDCIILQT